MTSEIIANPPSVSWAQGDGHVFLTFNVQCEKPDIQIEKNAVSFKGVGMPEQKLYQVDIPLYAEIDPDKSSYVNKTRNIELKLVKGNEDDTFWPSLTSDKKKRHWLKVDFDRWQDEEADRDSEDEYDQSDDLFKDKPFDDDVVEEDWPNV